MDNRRRESDRHREAAARENIDAIIHVLCDYLSCDRNELLDSLRGMIKRNRRARKLLDGASNALTWTIVAAVLGGVGTLVLMAMKQLLNE